MNTEQDILNGRRRLPRIVANFKISLKFKNGSDIDMSIEGHTLTIQKNGVSCKLESEIPEMIKHVSMHILFDGNELIHTGQIRWFKREQLECGLEFKSISDEWMKILESMRSTESVTDRRLSKRRAESTDVAVNRRDKERRYSELLREIYEEDIDIEGPKVKTFLRSKSTTFTPEIIEERREWLSKQVHTRFKHINHFSEDASDFKGKIENPIGVVHVPLGIAGPLKINGKHAKGTFFVPLATTEGALVTSYTMGSHIVTRSGGANVSISRDELRIGPIFIFKTLREAGAFTVWLKSNFLSIKKMAESTSRHLRLNEISHIVNGRRVIVNFHYNTGDAMGMNMACKATDIACKMICSAIKPEEFWLRSNFNSNKKVTASNFVNGYGKTVSADVVIPRRLIGLLDTTPEAMERYFFRTLLSDAHAVMVGANGHFANAITAIYIACGQDVALVANAHLGISTCEVNKDGDLYFSAYLSNVLLGTVGGGTEFGTARECLDILKCSGSGHSNKFAEIVAATALAGEIAICASVVNGTYVYAHEAFGRNRPK